MRFEWYDIIGFFGVAIIILTYVFLQAGKLESERLLYSAMNALGAALIIFSLYFNFNFPAFIVEFFWLLISLYGIAKYFFRKR